MASKATSPQNERDENDGDQPPAQYPLMSGSSEPNPARATPCDAQGEPDSSYSEHEEPEASHSSGSSESEEDGSGSSGEGADPEDDVDALTRGFELQACISQSTYLQTHDGKVIARGPGFSTPGRYISLNGNVHNTAKDPPEPCFNCQGNHWRIHCPYGRRYWGDRGNPHARRERLRSLPPPPMWRNMLDEETTTIMHKTIPNQ